MQSRQQLDRLYSQYLGALAMSPATPKKTSHLRNCDYFAINLSRRNSYNCTARSSVEVNTENERFNFVFFSCRKNRKNGNFTLLLRRRHGILLNCVPHVQHAYLSSLNQSNSWFMGLSLPLKSPILKIPI